MVDGMANGLIKTTAYMISNFLWLFRKLRMKQKPAAAFI